jgi:hypothetical protein
MTGTAGVAEMNNRSGAGHAEHVHGRPYDRKLASRPAHRHGGEQRTDINTQPDPYMQTTARDIGSSLQMLVACSEGGGTLIALTARRSPRRSASRRSNFMSLNEMTEMIVGGLPAGARAVHKHGYVPDTHGTSRPSGGPQGRSC